MPNITYTYYVTETVGIDYFTEIDVEKRKHTEAPFFGRRAPAASFTPKHITREIKTSLSE